MEERRPPCIATRYLEVFEENYAVDLFIVDLYRLDNTFHEVEASEDVPLTIMPPDYNKCLVFLLVANPLLSF